MKLDMCDIINDISGGNFDSKMKDLVLEENIPYILMHMRGTPNTMESLSNYGEIENTSETVLTEIKNNFKKFEGVPKWNIIVDPGIGFAKKQEHNIEIFRNLNIFR